MPLEGPGPTPRDARRPPRVAACAAGLSESSWDWTGGLAHPRARRGAGLGRASRVGFRTRGAFSALPGGLSGILGPVGRLGEGVAGVGSWAPSEVAWRASWGLGRGVLGARSAGGRGAEAARLGGRRLLGEGRRCALGRMQAIGSEPAASRNLRAGSGKCAHLQFSEPYLRT